MLYRSSVLGCFTLMNSIKKDLQFDTIPYTRGATKNNFSGQFFRIFEIIIFCFVVSICDLMHDVETMFHISYVLTAFGNLI